jgi:hypothetical protein
MGQQRFDLRTGEKPDQSSVGRLLRDGQDALDLVEVIGQGQRRETKERPNGGLASVARAPGVVP